MKTRRWLVAVGSLALLAGSCKDSGPVAGDLSVVLATPNSDDGAIQFTATGASPATITGVTGACTGCKLFFVKVSDTQYKGVLTGTVAAGTLFRVSVSDTKVPGSYAVTVNAASSRTFVVRSNTGYSLTLK